MDALLDPEVLGNAALAAVLLTSMFVGDLLISRHWRKQR